MRAVLATVVNGIEPCKVVLAGRTPMPGHDAVHFAHEHLVMKIISLGRFGGKNIEEDEAIVGECLHPLVLRFGF